MEKELYIRPYTLDNRASGESFNASVFRGMISFAAFAKGGGRPAFKCNLTPFLYQVFLSAFNKIRKASPETKISIKKEKFVKENTEKPWQLEWVATFSKDAEMMYHIILTDCQNGNRSFDFAFRGTGGISIGSEPMPNADKSAFAFEAFAKWLENAMLTATWTDEKFDPKAARGGYGNNGGASGGYNKGSNSNGGASSNSAGDDEDLPF